VAGRLLGFFGSTSQESEHDDADEEREGDHEDEPVAIFGGASGCDGGGDVDGLLSKLGEILRPGDALAGVVDFPAPDDAAVDGSGEAHADGEGEASEGRGAIGRRDFRGKGEFGGEGVFLDLFWVGHEGDVAQGSEHGGHFLEACVPVQLVSIAGDGGVDFPDGQSGRGELFVRLPGVEETVGECGIAGAFECGEGFVLGGAVGFDAVDFTGDLTEGGEGDFDGSACAPCRGGEAEHACGGQVHDPGCAISF